MKRLITIILPIALLLSACNNRDGNNPENGSSAVSAFNYSESEINLIRSFVDDALFEKYPISGIGSGNAENNINVNFMRTDEQVEELREEVMAFISAIIEENPKLSKMNIDMDLFSLKGSGSEETHPVEDLEPNSLVPDNSKKLPELFIDDITSIGLSYTFVNQTDMEFTDGEDYSLFVRDGDVWRKLNGGMVVTLIGYTIAPMSQTISREVNWEWVLREELPVGEYKFQKRILFVRQPGDFDEHTLEQRFTID
ncbi:MAG: hypothetical protein FWF94_00095 [Oscillospiraceae bacterium]|nr:hypothetical protein [Oscillospiraceae bacterium]